MTPKTYLRIICMKEFFNYDFRDISEMILTRSGKITACSFVANGKSADI